MKSLNKNGVSTTQTLGQEQYVTYTSGAFRGKEYYQYDYRHTDGMLFYEKKNIMRSFCLDNFLIC